MLSNSIDLSTVLKSMSDGEGEWEIHTYNHCTVVAPNDRGAIVERIGNEFGELSNVRSRVIAAAGSRRSMA